MPTCTCCAEEFEELENWGLAKLCKECVELYRHDYPEKKRITQSDLKIGKPKLGSRASYGPKSGKTILRQDCYDDNIVEEAINHEFLHFLLHRMFGLKCCYQFDSVYEIIDPYHGLS